LVGDKTTALWNGKGKMKGKALEIGSIVMILDNYKWNN